ncbi:MAG TPA: phosphate ABC transporter substrate-binding protein PstS [Stellaceae bacterium]|jgi:phosphate transport system substrate-binding protein|nr:phosphate ABC transporter substrate-binding protein PstS [Stellaceae bacterium]
MAVLRKTLLAWAIATLGVSATASAAEISGAGATFPYPIYAKWADAYKAKTGLSMNYQSIGSGGGIKQITSKTVNFGASDMPLKGEQLAKEGLAQWPMVMGGVVPVINLQGIQPGQIKLDGKTLAGIYLGKIKEWNDPAIVQLNPGVTLPNKAIASVHRSDGSGTNFLFTYYLSQVDPEFKEKIGSNTSVSFPGGLGGKGNEGVAALTSRTDGAIGYVEFAYALQNKMAYAQLRNRDGVFVAPEMKSFQAAAAGADWSSAPGFGVLLTNQPGKDSWPITGSTLILMHKQQSDPEKAKAVLDFFDWAYRNGSQMAEQLHYVPMPGTVAGMVEQMWKKEIVGPDGKPVWDGRGS